jgi:uncharacterized membrane protein
MTSTGGGAHHPVVVPINQNSKPPIRVPDKPPSRWTYIRENLVKWSAIALVVFLLGLFVYLAINGFEEKLTPAQVTQTRVAVEATRDARR